MKKFGFASRVSYDSKEFYARALYTESNGATDKAATEYPVDSDVTNNIFCQDSRKMHQLPDSSVHLMITSPPYNVGKEYDENLSLADFRTLLREVFTETYRVLVPGGRACINVANLGRKPYIPLHSYIIEEMHQLGFLMRGEIIWDKSASAGTSTAWGSWRSASNPILRDVHEYILIFSKGSFQRLKGERKNSIGRDQFLEYTKSIWTFPAESAKRVKHPAPFPLELPRRLIELYSFEHDIVLDPFAGSGSTCCAAIMAKRRYVGFDCSASYVDIARKRIEIFTKELPSP